MPTLSQPALKPRKTPLQARSTTTVDAILQATLQVLTSVGKERLTTTRVAARAGVSVGTLYQYFPNKSALLQATLRRHMDHIRAAIDRVCAEQQSQPLLTMATALIDAFLAAKMQHVNSSAALYSVSSDVDGAAIAKAAGQRNRRALVDLFATAREPLAKDPDLIATIVVSALNGFSRSLLESKSPDRDLDPCAPSSSPSSTPTCAPASPDPDRVYINFTPFPPITVNTSNRLVIPSRCRICLLKCISSTLDPTDRPATYSRTSVPSPRLSVWCSSDSSRITRLFSGINARTVSNSDSSVPATSRPWHVTITTLSL